MNRSLTKRLELLENQRRQSNMQVHSIYMESPFEDIEKKKRRYEEETGRAISGNDLVVVTQIIHSRAEIELYALFKYPDFENHVTDTRHFPIISELFQDAGEGIMTKEYVRSVLMTHYLTEDTFGK